VIVIGAGVSGLAAALELGAAGRRVLIMEARRVAGGRIRTLRLEGIDLPVELGAEFVHGGNAALRGALRRAGVQLAPVARGMWLCERGTLQRASGYWREIGRVLDEVPARTAMSFASFLRRLPGLLPTERWRLRSFAEGFNAAPAEKLSARALREDCGGTDTTQWRPRGGYGPLVDDLVRRVGQRGVEMRLGEAVTGVTWKRGVVEVRAGATVHRAAAAVITLPLGVWRAGTVKFFPDLKAKRRIVNRLGWGQAVRLTLRFRRDSWPAPLLPPALRPARGRSFGFLNAAQAKVPTWWMPAAGEPVLVGWAGGPAARTLARLDGTELQAVVLRSLGGILGQPAELLAPALEGMWMHDWSADEFARGAYSYAAAGYEKGWQRLAQPVGGTLFFAGEATAEEMGTVHGALASGLRAAREILQTKRRPG